MSKLQTPVSHCQQPVALQCCHTAANMVKCNSWHISCTQCRHYQQTACTSHPSTGEASSVRNLLVSQTAAVWASSTAV